MINESETSVVEFSQRKKDHIEISLREDSQSLNDQFSKIQLLHNPLPEIDIEEVSLKTQFANQTLNSPLFISSMTLGHKDAAHLNETLVGAAEEMGWMVGVGSQRRQLFDPEAAKECQNLKQKFPQATVFGNIGLAQLIHTSPKEIQKLVDSLGAAFMVVHTNPLQEAIQGEGTPQFKGGLNALKTLCEELSVPVVLKETGSGFSQKSLESLKSIPLAAVDLSGKGGTHWGRVETRRFSPNQMEFHVGQSFDDWGISTVDSLKNALKAQLDCPVWGSGGVRNGVQAAKLLAAGASMVGFAQPMLKAALAGKSELLKTMKVFEQELKIAMFCMGVKDINQLVGNGDVHKWM